MCKSHQLCQPANPLSSQLIRRVKEDPEFCSGYQLAYFFVSQKENTNGRENRRPYGRADILRSLLSQLAITSDGYVAESVRELYNSVHLDQEEGPTPLQSKQRLIESCSSCPTILIVDGLEECEGLPHLMKVLEDVVTSENNTRLLLSSNEGAYEQRKLFFRSCREEEVDAKRNSQAIKHHCFQVVNHHCAPLNDIASKELQESLVQMLAQKSSGT